MGVTATAPLLADAVDQAKTFVHVFVTVYTLVILAYIVTSWLRLPYSPSYTGLRLILQGVDPTALEAAFRQHAASPSAARQPRLDTTRTERRLPLTSSSRCDALAHVASARSRSEPVSPDLQRYA